MNTLILQFKKVTPLCLIVSLLAGFAPLPMALALLPPPAPDGDYPGANTAEGDSALFNVDVTTGFHNTAIGFFALKTDTTGGENTAVGAFALQSNVNGTFNTALGSGALSTNSSGVDNTAIGAGALAGGTSGHDNTACGGAALFRNNGNDNTAIGVSALQENDLGSNNVASGFNALFFNQSGSDNVASGVRALLNNQSGSNNVASGSQALSSNKTGNNNTASGLGALSGNVSGGSNTATGFGALGINTASFNTATGAQALQSNTSGTRNTASGLNALRDNTIGSFNIAVGALAGANLTTGNNNIDIGNAGAAGETETIRIGVQGTQTRTFVAGISGSAITGTSVVVNANGRLGTVASSQRFKDDIKPMDKASEAILALKPVTFHYKKEIDPDGIRQFGLVAEQVEKVNPDLVARDENGEIYTVRYEAVNAMLLNEFLKEHRKVEQQESTITQLKNDLQATAARQQKQIEALTAGLQKVSAQLEESKPASRAVVNNQ